MNLAFKEKIKGKETGFIEKIWSELSIKNDDEDVYLDYWEKYLRKFDKDWERFSKPFGETAKKHTIRIDEKDRWKVGNKIHFIVNNRSKNRFQFAPVLPVTAIQKIRIANLYDSRAGVLIDGKALTEWQIGELARNDGFDTVDEFWDFFSGQDFEGKIIYWTPEIDYSLLDEVF